MEYVLPVQTHDTIIGAGYKKRGYDAQEISCATHICRLAAWHGIKTHNGIKALQLDDHLGSSLKPVPGCVPGAVVIKEPSKFEACQKWIANRMLGQAVAMDAMQTATQLADKYGVGIVCVDQAFHYLWGGGYVMEAAKQGYIAYTNCTSALAETVPFMGKFPTLGTNPHSWGFPTTEAVGFPIVIDWATSVIAMGRVQQAIREGMPLPPNAAVDKDGNPTTDPNKVAALLPFSAHKGYGLSLINELIAALIGGSLPTIRCRPDAAGPGEKFTPSFFFQVIHPEAINCGTFACGRSQSQNVKAVIQDILGHGNENCMLPGQVEAEAAKRSEAAGGLLFTGVEIEQLELLATDAGVNFSRDDIKAVAC